MRKFTHSRVKYDAVFAHALTQLRSYAAHDPLGYDRHRMRIAVLGLGFMGSTHIQALQNIPGVTLAAIFSRNEKKLSGDLSSVQGNIGGPGGAYDFSSVRRCTLIESILEDPDIDAVDICLPTDLHAAVAVEALRAGKDVLLEKPMALDAASARRVIAEAAAQGRILMTAQVLRFMAPYRALITALEEGRLGTIRHATFRRRCAAPAWSGWLADPKHSGGGVFDLLIHDVDIALRLFGPPAFVSAFGYEDLPRGIDVISGQLHYPAQGTAIIAGGWHHPKSYPFSMEYTVVADEGTVEYSSQGRDPSLYSADGAATPLPLENTDGYREEIAYFIECCRTRTQPSLCPPEHSAQAVELTRLLLEGRNRNGERIPCSL
jgi:predicted dehydrogenase